jgi:uncharacterized membrane protein
VSNAITSESMEFRAGVIQPVECIKEGWQLIRQQYWLMVAITAVAMLLRGIAPFGLLMGPMMCGIYLALFALMRGERIDFGTLFKGFDYFVQSLIATLIAIAPVLILVIPIGLLFFGGLMAGIGLESGHHGSAAPAGVMIAVLLVAALCLMTVVVAATVFFTFSYPLIVDRKLSGVDACKTSARAGLANFGGILGLMVLAMLMGMAGVLVCYVGVFLVMPVTVAATAVAYRRVFPEATS